MKMIVFDIANITQAELLEKSSALARELNGLAAVRADRFQYTIATVTVEKGILSGILYQEYHGGQVTVDPRTKTVEEIAQNPWEETIFILIPRQGIVFFEKKRYSPKNLNHSTAYVRFETLLKQAWERVSTVPLALKPIQVGGDMNYIREIFRTEDVRRLQVGGLGGSFLSPDTPLHNPNRDRDKEFARTWNDYESPEIEEISLVAKKGKTLKKSVIAKAILAVGEIPKRVDYYDHMEDEVVTVTQRTLKHLIVDAVRMTSGITRLERALEKIRRIIEKYGEFRM